MNYGILPQGNSEDARPTVIYDKYLTATEPYFDIVGIPHIFSVLKFYLSLRSDFASDSDYVTYTFNEDAGANYYWMFAFLRSAGVAFVTGVADTSMRQLYCTAATPPAGLFSIHESIFYDYSNVNKVKQVLTTTGLFNGTAAATVQRGDASGWWNKKEPINRIRVASVNGKFVAESRATLIGYR